MKGLVFLAIAGCSAMQSSSSDSAWQGYSFGGGWGDSSGWGGSSGWSGTGSGWHSGGGWSSGGWEKGDEWEKGNEWDDRTTMMGEDSSSDEEDSEWVKPSESKDDKKKAKKLRQKENKKAAAATSSQTANPEVRGVPIGEPVRKGTPAEPEVRGVPIGEPVRKGTHAAMLQDVVKTTGCSAIANGTCFKRPNKKQRDTESQPAKVEKPVTKSNSERYPNWPTVMCKECGSNGKWSKMEQSTVWLNYQEKQNDPLDDWYYEYLCPKCVSQREGCTIQEAILLIHKSHSGWERRLARSNEFKDAMVDVQEEFKGICGRATKFIARTAIQVVLEPLAKYLNRKTKVLEHRATLVDRHAALMIEFENCDRDCNLARSKQIMTELEKLIEQIEETERPLAFRERAERDLPGAAPLAVEKQQWRYFLAATFSDLWSAIYDKSGNMVGAFMTFYVCLGNVGTEKCGTIICSKIWDRLFEDPMAVGQRYYCRCCNGRYRHAHGTLIQVQAPGCSPTFLRATVPPTDNSDVVALSLEDTLDPTSPEDLYNRLPTAVPYADGTFIRPAVPGDMYRAGMSRTGVWKILQIEAFMGLPLYPWAQMFNLFNEKKAGSA